MTTKTVYLVMETFTFEKPRVHSAYSTKEVADKARDIIKEDSEVCGDHWTEYNVEPLEIKDEAPARDPGLG